MSGGNKSENKWKPESIDFWKIRCESVWDVVVSELMSDLVWEVWLALTDIVRWNVLSDIDFSNIKNIYTKVYVDGERVISIEDYTTLYDFITSEKVKKYFIKLLSEENIEMSWNSAKQNNLRDNILRLSADRTAYKFKPIVDFLLWILKNKKEFKDDNAVLVWYKLRWSHMSNQSRVSSTKRDEDLEIHSFQWDTNYWLVWYRDWNVFELAADYKTIYQSHKLWDSILFRANKESWQGCLVIVWDEIKESGDFDYKKCPTFDTWSIQVAQKDTWKWLVYFNGTKIINLTDFEYESIDESGPNWVYVLKKSTKEKYVVHVSSDWIIKEYSWDAFTDVKDFHNTTILWEDFIVWRVYRWNKWSYLKVWDNEIEDFWEWNFTQLPLFKESKFQFAKKDEWIWIVEFAQSWLVEVIACRYKEISKAFKVEDMQVYKAVIWNWVFELVFYVDGVWIETKGDIKSTHWISTWNLGVIKDSSWNFSVVEMSTSGLNTIVDSASKVEKQDDNFLSLRVFDTQWNASLCLKMKNWKILKTESIYSEISWPGNRWIIRAQKDTWYGLLKIEWDSIVEISNFDFSSKLDLDDYAKYILEKDTWKWIAKFTKEGLSELTKFEFEDIWSFDSRNFSKVKKGGKYWIIHRKWDEYTLALACEYTEIWEFNENWLALASRDGEGYWLIHGKSWSVQEFSDSFHFSNESLSQLVTGEYRIWRMFANLWGEQREWFAAYSKNGLRDMGEYNYEDIEKWNSEWKVFYWKIAGWNWWVLRQSGNEIQVIWEHHDYIDAPNSIWNKKLDVFQKDTWYWVVFIKWDIFEELSDFEYESLPQIDSEWSYVAKKNWKFGMICYQDHQICEWSEFVFDTTWNPDSNELQENTIDGKKIIFYNTPDWVQIMEEGIESLEEYDSEKNLFLMQKDWKKALVRKINVEGKIDYEYISQFEFIDFWKIDSAWFVIAQKDDWYWVVTLIDWELREVNIIAQADSSLWDDINFKCSSIERLDNDLGKWLFKVSTNQWGIQVFSCNDFAMFPISSDDYERIEDLNTYHDESHWDTISVSRSLNQRQWLYWVSVFDERNNKLVDALENNYDEIELFTLFAIVNKGLKDSIVFLWIDVDELKYIDWEFKNIACLDEQNAIFLMSHQDGTNSIYKAFDWALEEISPRFSSIEDIIYSWWGEVLIKCFEKWLTWVLRKDESGKFYLSVDCKHSQLLIEDWEVRNPDKMWWFQKVSLG